MKHGNQDRKGERVWWREWPVRGTAALVLTAAGLSVVACSEDVGTTISSAETIAARPTPAAATSPTNAVSLPVDERIYRNQIAALSGTLGSEFARLDVTLGSPQASKEWVDGLSNSISQVKIQLDLLKQLKPPAEKYVAFDAALDSSLDAYIIAMDHLTAALQAADTAQIVAAGEDIEAAGAAFSDAVALMPPE